MTEQSETTPPEPIRSFWDAVNRHDREAFLDAFAEDGAVDDWGRTFTGRDEIAGWSDREFVGSNGVLTTTDVTVSGDEITVVGDWRSSHANGLSRFSFVTRGDKIAKMTIRAG